MILFALGLPWLTGALFVMALWRSSAPGYVPCVIGLGFPLGTCSLVAGYMAVDTWAQGLYFWPNVGIQCMLFLMFGCVVWRRSGQERETPIGNSIANEWQSLSWGWRWLLGFLAAWLVLRWLGIVLEVTQRPLFPWDAWSGYAVEAKLWFFIPEAATTTSIKPFLQGEAIWTGGTKHPSGVALLQLWMLQALGRWDDALMNMAWPVGLASLGFLLFGLLRVNAIDLRISALVTASVLTLPMVNIHAALAGYADLWIGILLLCSVGSAMLSLRAGLSRLLIVSMFSAMGMLLFKGTSAVWVMVVLFGLMFGRLPLRLLVPMLIIVPAGLGLCLWFYGTPVRIPMVGQLGFRDGAMVWPQMPGSGSVVNRDAILSFIQHLFLVDNWHLFWYLAVPAWLAGVWWLGARRDAYMLFLVVTTCMVLVVLAISMTVLGHSVVDGTRVNRILLHLVPVVALMGGCVAARLQDAMLEVRGSRGWSS